MATQATPAAPGAPATPTTPATPGAGGTLAAPAASASSIQELTSQMTQLTQSGAGKDTQLSDAARQKYIAAIATFRSTLADQRRRVAAELTNYGQVGGLLAADHTKSQLTLDVTAPADGFLAVLDNYLSYLDQLEKTVNAAFARMQAEDNAA